MLSEEMKKRIAKTLDERFRAMLQATQCPMCGVNDFAISDGYVVVVMQEGFRTLTIGGPSIPAIALICKNCGFISHHALGALGLLPKPQDNLAQGKGGKN